MRLSHLNALQALEATIRCGGFTAAAHELGVTPAAVGQRVRSLEEFIGRDLFRRSSTGVEPLDRALEVERDLRTGISALSSAMERLRRPDAGTRLSVTLPASFAEHWFTSSISEFYQRHEEIDLRLDASNRDVDLLREPFDFAIRYGQSVGAPLEALELFGDAVLPVCSPEFQQRYKLAPSQRSLEGVPLIHVENRTRDPGWVGFDGWGRAFGFDPDHLSHGVRYSRLSSGLKSAIEGQGMVLSGLVESFNALRAGQLVMPFGPHLRHETDYSYRLIWVRGKKMTAIERDFADWVVDRSARFRKDVARLVGKH